MKRSITSVSYTIKEEPLSLALPGPRSLHKILKGVIISRYMKRIFFVFALLFLVGCGGKNYDTFSECLTEKGAAMYGAYWCPHCINQKEEFGGSWKFVTYVECSLPQNAGQTPQCREAGITGYPTWVFDDGSRVEGEASFETLASKTGCTLPE